jgi:CheY-like chemotaxis protein
LIQRVLATLSSCRRNSRSERVKGRAGLPARPRVLLVLERPALVELIKTTLNHGVHAIHAATTVDDVTAALTGWQPHLAIVIYKLRLPNRS